MEGKQVLHQTWVWGILWGQQTLTRGEVSYWSRLRQGEVGSGWWRERRDLGNVYGTIVVWTTVFQYYDSQYRKLRGRRCPRAERFWRLEGVSRRISPWKRYTEKSCRLIPGEGGLLRRKSISRWSLGKVVRSGPIVTDAFIIHRCETV